MRPSEQFLAEGDGARPRLRRTLASIVVAFVAIGALFAGGDFLLRHGIYRVERVQAKVDWPVTSRAVVRDMGLNALANLSDVASRRLLESGLPIYDLQIEDDELQALHRTADRVIARGVSLGVERLYENARFCLAGEWLDVELKLRGLISNHYNKNHFSFRMKMPANRLLAGVRELSLLEPYDKGLVIDAISHRELARVGVLTVKDRFVVVRINGRVVGLFQEFEHFGRSVADGNGRPEGYIFTGTGHSYEAPGAAWLKASAAIKKARACAGLEGPKPKECGWPFISQYFDVDRLAWASAMASLLHSNHAWNRDNLRLFWDPARGAFEPIPWDYAQYSIDLAVSPDGETARRPFFDLLMGDGRMRGERDRRLWSLLRDRVDAMRAQAQRLFDELKPALKEDLRHPGLALDEERLRGYQRTLRSNAAILRTLLEAADLRVVAESDGEAGLALRVANHARSPVELLAVILDDGQTVPLPGRATAEVAGSWKGKAGERSWRLTLPSGRHATGLQARNAVTGTTVAAAALKWTATKVDQLAPVSAPAEVSWTLDLEGVRIDGQEVHFGPGLVELRRKLEIPRGFKVVFAPGLDLRMGMEAAVLIYGDLLAQGTKEAPILVRALVGAQGCGGLAVQGTSSRPSRVDFRHFKTQCVTGTDNERTWFTGPVAVHGGVVTIEHSSFLGSTTDDGINLKYCQVDISHSLFGHSRDDAFDCDFCTGRFAHNKAIGIGGDAFDFSGSDVVVEDCFVEMCGDKGFSFGEGTQATVRRGRVADCATGIAAKDGSQVLVKGVTLERVRVGLAEYSKKVTFGRPSLTATHILPIEVATRWMREVPPPLDGPGGCLP